MTDGHELETPELNTPELKIPASHLSQVVGGPERTARESTKERLSIPRRATTPSSVKVAYVMSRFPKITETFVFREILEIRRHGFDVELFPLICLDEVVEQPEVATLRSSVHVSALFSLWMLPAHARRILRSPLRYARALTRALWHHRGTRRAFFGAAATFPKAVYIAEQMERRGITRIHAHFANNPALAASVVSALTGIPFSFTAHGSDIHRDQSGLRSKVAASEFTIMISDYNRRFVAERSGSDLLPKMRVVHCGVDTDVFTPGDRRSTGTLRILCVAALRAVKGHQVLLDACALLRAQGVDFECELVGDGPLRDTLKQSTRALGLEGHVIFSGPKPGPEVLERMRQADVVVLPSILDAQGRREGIPVTLMEAMSCETPVAASRISGIPELVDDGCSGLLFEPGNAADLARVLIQLRDDPELGVQLGRRGREKVLSEFRLEACVAQLADHFRASPSGGRSETGLRSTDRE